MNSQNRYDNVATGCGLLALCHLIFIAALGVISETWIEPSSLVVYSPEGEPSGAVVFLLGFFGIGLAQVIYVLPLLSWLEMSNYKEAAKGVWIAAAITLLINGTCFLFVI